MDLFICWANVGRSQVAEGIAKSFGKEVISCASVEARKEKYNFKPEKEITDILKSLYNIDISNQVISYPKDILDYLDNVGNIYLLFDPKEVDKKVNKELLIDNLPFWEYLDKIGKKYFIYKIEDPDTKDKDTIKAIVEDIYNLIIKIYS